MDQDMRNAGARARKTYGQCKLRCCFPDCPMHIRKHRLPDGELICKQTGQHAHDRTNETYCSGSPQRYEDLARELLLINIKFRPSFIG